MADIAAVQPAHSAHPSTPEWKNLFGVCAAIGEELGFDPLWLRLAFAMPLIWFPAVVLSAYAACGLVVLASRLAYPRRRVAAAAPIVFVPRPASQPLPLAA